MAGIQRTGGNRQFNAIQTGLAVNRCGDLLLADKGPIATGVHRDVRGLRHFQNGPGVVRHLFKALIAAHRGHTH